MCAYPRTSPEGESKESCAQLQRGAHGQGCDASDVPWAMGWPQILLRQPAPRPIQIIPGRFQTRTAFALAHNTPRPAHDWPCAPNLELCAQYFWGAPRGSMCEGVGTPQYCAGHRRLGSAREPGACGGHSRFAVRRSVSRCGDAHTSYCRRFWPLGAARLNVMQIAHDKGVEIVKGGEPCPEWGRDAER